MKRSQLEHLIRAAGTITNEDELIIIAVNRLEQTEIEKKIKQLGQNYISQDFKS